MGYCLIPQLANKLKKSFEKGEMSFQKLHSMGSEERHKIFSQIVGEDDAKNVNALFESKLLLKNQKQGMITWLKTATGMKEPVRRDIFATIERLDKVLNPEEQKDFLGDLVNKRLGTDVSIEESKEIYRLSQAFEKTKAGLNPDNTFKSESARMDYGLAKADLHLYVRGLKEKALSLTKEDFSANPVKAAKEVVSKGAGELKASVAMLDDGAIFRQGWKTLWTHNKQWRKNAVDSFKTIWKELGGKETERMELADTFTRKNNLNRYYDKAKLYVGVTEEAFPASSIEKIPYYKRLYKASESAYKSFLQRQRKDIFDRYIDIAEKSGVELTDRELKSIGKMVNSLTGRASLGKLEPIADQVNNIFFSPRLLWSNVDVLGGHVLTGAGGSNFVRKQAAINLVKIISGTAAVLATAKIFDPDSVDLDTTSSDFGKIKVKNTRFDVTGGMGSIVVLASRLIQGKSKSSTTGRITELNSDKFGSMTKWDVVMNFGQNKLSPAASIINDLFIRGKNFKGEKPTVKDEVVRAVTPFILQNIGETYNDPESADVLLISIAEALGISTQTYSKNDFKKGK